MERWKGRKYMTESKGKKIRFIYGIFFTVLTLVVGALFIVQICSIYHSAPSSPYSVESISAHFNQIAIPVWLWVAALIANIVLSYVFEEGEETPKATVSVEVKLNRLKRRLPENPRSGDPKLVRLEKILRKSLPAFPQLSLKCFQVIEPG